MTFPAQESSMNMDMDWQAQFIKTARALDLTARQADLLRQAACGRSNKAIAHAEGVGTSAITFSLSKAYDRLGASHRGHAIAIVMRNMLEATDAAPAPAARERN